MQHRIDSDSAFLQPQPNDGSLTRECGLVFFGDIETVFNRYFRHIKQIDKNKQTIEFR